MASNVLKRIDGLLLLFVLMFSLPAYSKLNQEGLEEFHYEIKKNNIEYVSKILEQYPGVANQHEQECQEGALHVAARKSTKEMVTLLITKGKADLELKDDLDFTPIIPAMFGDPENLATLIDYGAQVNVRIKPSEDTPLHNAVKTGFVHAVAILLVAGASRDAVDYEGKKPIDHLKFCENPVNALIIEFLLRNFQGPALPDFPQ